MGVLSHDVGVSIKFASLQQMIKKVIIDNYIVIPSGATKLRVFPYF
jgi:hypothetical protein